MIFFPGGLPSQAFENCFLLFCGYRTTTSRCGHHHSGCFHWALPAVSRYTEDELLLEANDARFDVRQMSVLHCLKEREYVIDENVWKYISQLSDELDWSHLAVKFGEDTSKVRSSCRLQGVMNTKLRFHVYPCTRLGKFRVSRLLSTTSEAGVTGV